MTEHLWTNKPPPQDYIEYKLCEFYKCLPSQLAREDWATIRKHLKIMGVEARIAKANAETAKAKRKRK